jgi:hypothetical protein
MTGQCCTGGGPSARRLSGATASIVPGALLALLPKCPLCIAAWLTAVTGVGFPPAGVTWLREIIVVFWAGALAVTVRHVRSNWRAAGTLRGAGASACLHAGATGESHLYRPA